MDYAIVSNMESAAFCSERRIAKENIVLVNQTPELIERVQAGDSVSIANIAIFPSVTYFWTFCQRLIVKEVKLKVLKQPKLEFGGGKCWKISVGNYVKGMKFIEMQIPTEISKALHLNTSGQNFVRRLVEHWMIRIVAETFLKDGILSRS